MSILTALIQITSGRDIEDNLAKSERLGALAAEAGADWLVFPENAPFLGADRERDAVAQDVDGSMVSAYRDIASRHSVWVTIGGYPELYEQPSEGGNNYNTQVLIGPDGAIVATYRKLHLFDAQVDSETAYCESDYVRAGNSLSLVEVEIAGERLKIGMTTCYDLRFPELYRLLRDGGADVITVPSAFTLQTGRDHWHPLLAARAIENQVYVVAPDQFGHHFGKRWSYGHSTIYDPWGARVVDAPDRECFVLGEIDLDYLRRVRQRMPVASHRRDYRALGAAEN